MSTSKKLICAIAIGAVFLMTGGMVEVADQFFAAVKANDIETAYSYLSEDFKATTSKEELQRYLARNALAQFKEANWSERSVKGGRGILTGSITTVSGGVVPVKVSFVKGESGWKIYSVQKPAAGLQEEASQEMPSKAEQRKLVRSAMQIFAVSANEKSMKKFHDAISTMWRKQYSVAKLDEAYGPIMKIGVDLTILRNINPVFDQKTALDEDGVLLLKGHYPTKPNRVYFEQKYIYQGLDWKLLGFNINIR